MIQKPKNTSNITLGTAYDINKELVEKYEKEIFVEDFGKFYDTFQNYILSNVDSYYMLLCNEEKDYTIFSVESDIDITNIFSELKECIFNRGRLYGFDITKDNQAIEIWIKTGNGIHCYYFFKYGSAVIKC